MTVCISYGCVCNVGEYKTYNQECLDQMNKQQLDENIIDYEYYDNTRIV